MIYKTNSYIKITLGDGTSFTIPPRLIQSIEPTQSVQFQENTELLTGVADPPNTVITIVKPKAGQDTTIANFLGRSFDWRLNKVEIYYSVNNGSSYFKLFDGLTFVRAEDKTSVTFTCRGYLDLLNITLLETPLFRNRKVSTFIPGAGDNATRYTLSLAQDPTRAEGANVGVINAILWLMGGRPRKYRTIYLPFEDALVNYLPKFYYDCQASVVNPEWIWFNYENLFSDLSLLCKASGGLLFQDQDGMIVYENIFNIRKTSTGVTLTDSNYSSLDISDYNTEPYKDLVVTFNPRYLSASQEVFNANLDEYLKFGEEVERRIEFEKPVWKLVNKTISGQLTDTIVSSSYKVVKDKITAVDLFGNQRNINARVAPHNIFYIPKYVASGALGNFVQVRDMGVSSSQSTTLHVKNDYIADQSSVYMAQVTLFGRALDGAPPESYIKQINQFATISGYRQLKMGDNPYIQSKSQARRFADVAANLMQNTRQKIAVKSVPYSDSINIGDVININSTAYGINDSFKVYGYTISNNMHTVDLELISVSGLYTESDVFIVGTTYNTNDQRVLSF